MLQSKAEVQVDPRAGPSDSLAQLVLICGSMVDPAITCNNHHPFTHGDESYHLWGVYEELSHYAAASPNHPSSINHHLSTTNKPSPDRTVTHLRLKSSILMYLRFFSHPIGPGVALCFRCCCLPRLHLDDVCPFVQSRGLGHGTHHGHHVSLDGEIRVPCLAGDTNGQRATYLWG